MAALLIICEQGEGFKDGQGAEETTADPDQNSGEDLHARSTMNPKKATFSNSYVCKRSSKITMRIKNSFRVGCNQKSL